MVLAALVVSASPVLAQAPAISRGQQILAIPPEEAARRAPQALQAEGYRLDNNGPTFIFGYKGVHAACIMWNAGADGKTYVNIVVASSPPSDGDIAGRERQNLQRQMDVPSSTGRAASFSGVWDTGPEGEMTLQQDGNRVTGMYTFEDGKIEGLVTDNILNLTWSQKGGRRGTARFTLSEDGNRFTGTFTVTDSGGADRPGSGSWNGTRKQAAAPRPTPSANFAGNWQTEDRTRDGSVYRYDIRLNQTGDRVTGTYAYGAGGSIEGTVTGNLLTFTWTENNSRRRGTGQFTLAADGKSFSGSYAVTEAAGGSTGGGQWTGTRK